MSVAVMTPSVPVWPAIVTWAPVVRSLSVPAWATLTVVVPLVFVVTCGEIDLSLLTGPVTVAVWMP